MKFARIIFALAGTGGFLLLAPLYFMETRIGANEPPAVTHPEYFYGFIGVALTWQVVCWVIAWSPVRYRPMMVVAALEKMSFGGATIVLFSLHRISAAVLAFGAHDLWWAGLFLVAYARFPKHQA